MLEKYQVLESDAAMYKLNNKQCREARSAAEKELSETKVSR
jgi:hypothetical protein